MRKNYAMALMSAMLIGIPGISAQILETPEGDFQTLSRSGQAIYPDYGVPTEKEYNDIPGALVIGENDEVYLLNPISQHATGSYIVGKKDGDKYVFQLPQLISEEEMYGETYRYEATLMQFADDEYGGYYYAANSPLAAEQGLPEIENELIISIGDDGTLIYESSDDTFLGMIHASDTEVATFEYQWAGCVEITSTWTPFEGALIGVPGNLQKEQLAVVHGDSGNFANVGFDDNKVYIQGLFSDMPDAWIVGTLQDGKVVFESNQYLGISTQYNCFCYFTGGDITVNETGSRSYKLIESLTFNYDSEAMKLTCEEGKAAIINTLKDRLYYLEAYNEPVIYRQANDISKTPLAASNLNMMSYGSVAMFNFDYSVLNVDHQLLDKNKLYYQIFLNDSEITFYADEYSGLPGDMDYLPVTLSNGYDILATDRRVDLILYAEGIEDIAVKMCYIEGDVAGGDYEVIAESPIVSVYTTGVGEINFDAAAIVKSEFYDMQGRKISNPDKGMFIRIDYTEDGKKIAKKILK